MPDYRAARKASRLAVEIETADGVRFTLDSDATRAEDRPVQISFRTQRGDGFADGSMTLRRSVLRDYPDLTLLNTVRFIGADGQIAYEGRIGGIARESSSDGHSITLPLQGWMAHAKAKRFRELYVDRDLSRWVNTPSNARQLQTIAAAAPKNYLSGASDVQFDPASQLPAVRQQITRIADTAATRRTTAECWYYANGIPIGAIAGGYGDKDKSTNAALPSGTWYASAGLETADTLTGSNATANLAGTTSPWSVSASATRYYAWLQFLFYGTSTADGEWSAYYRNPYVVGTHGLTLSSGGLTVSQMIKDSAARFAPKLDTTNVTDTTYPVQHAVAVDPVFPYDFWQQLNQLHLWELSVWEDRSLYFQAPSSLDDYDWQVRTDDPGVSLTFAGDSVTELYSGVEVNFTDLYTQLPKRITPDNYPADLADTDADNPATKAGEPRWYPYDLAFPATEADAVQYGRAQLAEVIRAKSPVQINAGFTIRDRAGNPQPTWKVRAGDRIAITDHPNDAPRRIVDTSYTHDGRGLSISADRASSQLAAVIDRISLARTAASLS